MKVRVITPFARYYAGEVRDVAPDLAAKWIRAGFVVAVPPDGLTPKDLPQAPRDKMIRKAKRKRK